MRLEAVALLAWSALSFGLTVPLVSRYQPFEHGIKMKRVILDAPTSGGFVVVGTPSFLNFADANRERVKKASPGANDRQVEELIDKEWDKLSPQVRAEWANKKPGDGPGTFPGGPGMPPIKWSNTTSSSASRTSTGLATPAPNLGVGRNTTATSTSTSKPSSMSSDSQAPPTITPTPNSQSGGAGSPPGLTPIGPSSNDTKSTSTSSGSTSSGSTTSTGTKTTSTQPPQNGPTGTPASPGSKPGIPPKPDGEDKYSAGSPYGNPGTEPGKVSPQLPPVDLGKTGPGGKPKGVPDYGNPGFVTGPISIIPSKPISSKLPSPGLDKNPPVDININPGPGGPLDPSPKLSPGVDLGPDDIMINPVRGGPFGPTPLLAPGGGDRGTGDIMINPVRGSLADPTPQGPLKNDSPFGSAPQGILGWPDGMMDDDDDDYQMPFNHPDRSNSRGSFQNTRKRLDKMKRPGTWVEGEDTPVTLDHDDSMSDSKPWDKKSNGGDHEVVLEDEDLLDGAPGSSFKVKTPGLPDIPGLLSVEVSMTKHSNWRRGERAQRVRRREVSLVSHDKRHVRNQGNKRELQHGYGFARG